MEGNVWIAKLQCDRELHKNVTHISMHHKYRRGRADPGEWLSTVCTPEGQFLLLGEISLNASTSTLPLEPTLRSEQCVWESFPAIRAADRKGGQ